MGGHAEADESYVFEPWYKYGIYFLFFEAAIAGETVQFKIKKVHQKEAVIESPAPAHAQQCAVIQKQFEDCLKEAGLSK